MDIPYGFDCYSFVKDEVKYFESNIYKAKHSKIVPFVSSSQIANSNSSTSHQMATQTTTTGLLDYVTFTRKNEDYPKEQVEALIKAGRLNLSEIDKKFFCGIKVQTGVAVITGFMQKGMQYRPQVRGRAENINGSWTGLMKGLTVENTSPLSYDLAFGNFLAWDEEFPYVKFGPFVAIESKLVLLTGSSRAIEASSFGTNVTIEIWFLLLSILLILSILSSLRIHWQHTKHLDIETTIKQTLARHTDELRTVSDHASLEHSELRPSYIEMLNNFLFIYFTMLLNKPSLEFDELIWPQHHTYYSGNHISKKSHTRRGYPAEITKLVESNPHLSKHFDIMMRRKRRRKLPTSIRALGYMWSAACLVMASIYSGEMLAVMLLRADQNIDTVEQLINSKPPIEPVIRQDDFTSNLISKSPDEMMIKLHNKTRIIPRTEVYSRKFIENISARRQALLGDDELIETVYNIYHKYYPLYISKMTYFQYPISFMYRMDLNSTLEKKLRKGATQIFEMGLTRRWYKAQEDTFVRFYEKKTQDSVSKDKNSSSTSSVEQKYKPLSLQHFGSFFRAMICLKIFASGVLLIEIIIYNYFPNRERRSSAFRMMRG